MARPLSKTLTTTRVDLTFVGALDEDFSATVSLTALTTSAAALTGFFLGLGMACTLLSYVNEPGYPGSADILRRNTIVCNRISSKIGLQITVVIGGNSQEIAVSTTNPSTAIPPLPPIDPCRPREIHSGSYPPQRDSRRCCLTLRPRPLLARKFHPS